MKCEKCLEEWKFEQLGARTVKFCPFCGYEYREKEPESFFDLIDCFRYLKRKYTYAIFLQPHKLLAYVSDYMPKLIVEKRVLKVVLDASVYRELLDDDGNVLLNNVDIVKSFLVNDYGLSEKWADEAVSWFVKAFVDFETEDNMYSILDTEAKNISKQINKLTSVTARILNKITGSDSKGNYTYKGQTDANGIPNGKGEMIYSSGEKYIGNFLDGFLTGEGKWVSSSGIKFEGMFRNGKQVECDGILTKRNGDVYKGHFRKGLRLHGIISYRKKGDIIDIKKKYDNGHFINNVY